MHCNSVFYRYTTEDPAFVQVTNVNDRKAMTKHWKLPLNLLRRKKLSCMGLMPINLYSTYYLL